MNFELANSNTLTVNETLSLLSEVRKLMGARANNGVLNVKFKDMQENKNHVEIIAVKARLHKSVLQNFKFN